MARVRLWLIGQIVQALEALLAARGRLMPWAPVFLSAGIGVYFALGVEPGWAVVVTLAGLCLAAALATFRAPELIRVPATACALVAGGFLIALARAHMVAAPVLAYASYGPVEGRIIDIDRSFSDQIRVTLDQVVMPKITMA